MKTTHLALRALGATIVLVAFAAPAAATSSVQAIDNWGRYVTGISVDHKFDAKVKNNRFVPRGTFLFLVPNADTDDIAFAQFRVGNKALGEQLRCPIGRPLGIDGTNLSVVVADCRLDVDKLGQTKPGKFSVTVGYRQTARGADHPDLATYEFTVGRHAAPGKRHEFHVDHDFRMGEAWAHAMQDGGFQIYTWFKVSSEPSTLVHGTRVRCFVGDAQWDFNQTTNDRYSAEFDDYSGGSPAKTRWQYNYFFPSGNAREFLQNNPGDYRCTLTRGGEIDREFHFTIVDGKPVKPACQTGDDAVVRAPESTTLIRQVFKTPQDAKFDAKAYEAGALFGRVRDISKTCGF